MKTCLKCGVEKEASEFYQTSSKLTDAIYLDSRCKLCRRTPAKERASERRKKRPEVVPYVKPKLQAAKVLSGSQWTMTTIVVYGGVVENASEVCCVLCATPDSDGWRIEMRFFKNIGSLGTSILSKVYTE